MANDYFQFRQFTVRQERCAMKVGTDGTLLGAWARIPTHHSPLTTHQPPRGGQGETSILDIGTGTGLIALMMAQRYPGARVTGIDIDAEAVLQAQENADASTFAQRIDIRLMDAALMDGGPYDAIVSNPPFFTASLHSPDARRTLARHTDTLSCRTLMTVAARLLADGGELSVVVPADSRSLMESEASLAGLFLTRRCAVRTAAHKAPKRHLLAFARHSGPLEQEELTLGSPAYEALTKDFYL